MKKLTAAQNKILQIIRNSTKPIGAYKVLDQYKKHYPKAAPPTIYRALDFLNKANLAHKIEKLNAYIACDHAHDTAVQFLVCTKCGKTREVDAAELGKNSEKLAKQVDFIVEQTILEIIGHCQTCEKI